MREGSRANAWPGLEELERQLLPLPSQNWMANTRQELSPWGNSLGREARNPKPHILRFQCLGRFQYLDRTSVRQTQNRQAWREQDRAASPSRNEHKGEDQKETEMWVQFWDHSLHMRPAWDIPSTRMHWEHPTQPSVGLRGAGTGAAAWRSDLVGSAAPDTPSSSARPAGHQQDWGRGVRTV